MGPVATRSPTAEFEHARARFEVDAAASARYVANYDGTHDALDALTWAARPGSTGPTGTPDPYHSEGELERLAFGRADDAERATAQARLAELQEAAAGQREAVRHAIEAAERDERVAQWHPRLESSLWRFAITSRETRPAMTAAASAIVLAFAALGVWGWANQLRGSLTVFDRPMSSRDESAPGWVFGTVLPVEQTLQVRWLGTNSRYNLYGVLGGDGAVCVAIVEPGVGGSSECASAEQFAAEGIRIEGDIAGREYAVRWGPVGQPTWENPSVLSS
jgi:hypothetical protein